MNVWLQERIAHCMDSVSINCIFISKLVPHFGGDEFITFAEHHAKKKTRMVWHLKELM